MIPPAAGGPKAPGLDRGRPTPKAGKRTQSPGRGVLSPTGIQTISLQNRLGCCGHTERGVATRAEPSGWEALGRTQGTGKGGDWVAKVAGGRDLTAQIADIRTHGNHGVPSVLRAMARSAGGFRRRPSGVRAWGTGPAWPRTLRNPSVFRSDQLQVAPRLSIVAALAWRRGFSCRCLRSCPSRCPGYPETLARRATGRHGNFVFLALGQTGKLTGMTAGRSQERGGIYSAAKEWPGLGSITP